MNERIKEITGQVLDEIVPETWVALGYDKIKEIQNRTAELIVRECISINRQRLFSDYEGDSHRVAHNNALLCANSDMFEHFGVEE